MNIELIVCIVFAIMLVISMWMAGEYWKEKEHYRCRVFELTNGKEGSNLVKIVPDTPPPPAPEGLFPTRPLLVEWLHNNSGEYFRKKDEVHLIEQKEDAYVWKLSDSEREIIEGLNKKGTMTVEEIKAKHQPRQLENQVEFDAIMSDINQQQGELNRPLIDRKKKIVKQRELLKIQKHAINQQLSALSAEYQDIEVKAKAINRPLHDLKHEWITLNPRERFIKPNENHV